MEGAGDGHLAGERGRVVGAENYERAERGSSVDGADQRRNERMSWLTSSTEKALHHDNLICQALNTDAVEDK